MSVNLDPSIDPITGLPVLNPSGPVQQIPLGQEVFPYADLNATAQPTRGPIYGDDIIPTSGLVTAPDKQMKPRSIQSTTTRELRVREAVFQNKGAAIPDGTTAPIDVNVVSGGGGGGGLITPNASSGPTDQTEFGSPSDDSMVFDLPSDALLYQVRVAIVVDPGADTIFPVRSWGFVWFYAAQNGIFEPAFLFGTVPFYYDLTDNVANPTTGVFEQTFPTGMRLTDVGFPSGVKADLYYHTTIAPIRLSGFWSWKA